MACGLAAFPAKEKRCERIRIPPPLSGLSYQPAIIMRPELHVPHIIWLYGCVLAAVLVVVVAAGACRQ